MEKFRAAIRIRFWYSEYFGPRFMEAGVSLHLVTADSYEFVNKTVWSSEDYSFAVERGAKDALIESGVDPELGIHITLEEIVWDDINSSESAFYLAAKCAVKSKFILREARLKNI